MRIYKHKQSLIYQIWRGQSVAVCLLLGDVLDASGRNPYFLNILDSKFQKFSLFIINNKKNYSNLTNFRTSL